MVAASGLFSDLPLAHFFDTLPFLASHNPGKIAVLLCTPEIVTQ